MPTHPPINKIVWECFNLGGRRSGTHPLPHDSHKTRSLEGPTVRLGWIKCSPEGTEKHREGRLRFECLGLNKNNVTCHLRIIRHHQQQQTPNHTGNVQWYHHHAIIWHHPLTITHHHPPNTKRKMPPGVGNNWLMPTTLMAWRLQKKLNNVT